jgi:integrase
METKVKKYSGSKDFSRINYQYANLMIRFKKADILEENKELVLEFIESCRLGLFQKKIGMQRTVRTLNSLKRLCQMLPTGLSWQNVTKKDVRSLLLAIEALGVGDWERYSLLMALKKFITWIRTEYGYPEGYPDREKNLSLLALLEVAPEVKIAINRPNKLKALNEIPTQEDINYMMAACDTYAKPMLGARDKAIISILAEIGARIGGIGNLHLRDIIFDSIGAKLRIEDKTMTGEPVRIISSVQYLKNWLELHPDKGNQQAPLWVTLRGIQGKMMDYAAVRKTLKNAVNIHNKNAEAKGQPLITKRIHPHGFRYYAQGRDSLAGMPIAIMCKQRGWSATSKQPQRYARISSEQVDNWLIANQTKTEVRT